MLATPFLLAAAYVVLLIPNVRNHETGSCIVAARTGSLSMLDFWFDHGTYHTVS